MHTFLAYFHTENFTSNKRSWGIYCDYELYGSLLLKSEKRGNMTVPLV